MYGKKIMIDLVSSSSRAKNLSLLFLISRSICNIFQIRLGKEPHTEQLNGLWAKSNGQYLLGPTNVSNSS